MKKVIAFSLTLVVFCLSNAIAQQYKMAAGLGLDVGDGPTLVGPTIKYFFKDNHAIEGEVLFGSPSVFIQAFYQYHQTIPGAKGLQWYAGGGPSLQLASGSSYFYLRPMVGLDYKLSETPLALSFDWRPFIYLGNTYGGSRFTAPRFGLGVKYILTK